MHVITTRPEGGFLLSGQSMESLERQTETTHRATASNDAVMLHMVCGKIASGKSTLTATLASAERTIPISEDDWLARLYPGEILSIDDYVRCATRINDVIVDHVRAVLQAGVPVVLDLPFNTVAARMGARRFAGRRRFAPASAAQLQACARDQPKYAPSCGRPSLKSAFIDKKTNLHRCSGTPSRILLAPTPLFILYRRRPCQAYFPMSTATGSSNIPWSTPTDRSIICRSFFRASCMTFPLH